MFGFEITSILWGIRTLRNAIRFNDKQADFEATLEAIKYRSWSWARAYVTLMLHYMFGIYNPRSTCSNYHCLSPIWFPYFMQ